MALTTVPVELANLDGAVTVNESSADVDFRIESNGNANMLFVDGGNDRVGIGTNSPATLLELSANNNSAASNNTLRFTDTDTGTEANQQIGKIEFKTDDASGDGALVRSYILSASEDATPSSYISFGTNAGGTGVSTAERLRINSSGALLHGTDTVPTGVLLGNQLVSSSATGAEIIAFRADTTTEAGDKTGAFLLGNSDSSGTEDHFVGMYGKAFDTFGRQHLHFVSGRDNYENDTPQMTLTSDGELCAGTTTAINDSHTFTVSQENNTSVHNNTLTSGNPYGIQVRFTGTGSGLGGDYYAAYTSTTGSLVKKFGVAGDGDVTNANNSYGAISDERLKENIVDATNKLDEVKQIKIRNFNFIGDDKKQIGVVAQELETIFPALITEKEDRDADGNKLGTTTKEVKYSVLLPIAIKAIQEQQALIETLQAEVKALKGE